MIDTTFWQAVADSWISIYSQEDIRRNESVVDEMFLDAMAHYVAEKSCLLYTSAIGKIIRSCQDLQTLR